MRIVITPLGAVGEAGIAAPDTKTIATKAEINRIPISRRLARFDRHV